MKKILYVLFCAFVLAACNPQQTAMEDLQTFTSRMEQKSSSWSLADWDDAAQHYDEITQTLKRYQYSDEELQEIGRLEGVCMAYFMEHYASQAVEQLHDAGQELQGLIDGFLETLGE